MHRSKVGFVRELCVDSLYIMVIYKIVEIQVSHIKQIFHCMGNFKIVVVIVSAVQCLMQGIVGHAVQGFPIDPAAVIPVDYLSHKPEICFDLRGCPAQCFHKIKVQYICCIQADSVHIKLRYPETDYITDIVLYLRISLV